MPIISSKNQEKIQEQILHFLFSISPESAFTNQVASEVVRDEEFTKSLLQDLKSKSLVSEINKNPSGKEYKSRQRWRLSSQAYGAYKRQQN